MGGRTSSLRRRVLARRSAGSPSVVVALAPDRRGRPSGHRHSVRCVRDAAPSGRSPPARHQEAEPLAVGCCRREDPDDPAAVHHGDPVGERQHLVELRPTRSARRRPRRASATIRRWMYSIEPTSRPRVGWLAISSLIGRENSRATMTFCWLPPESVPAGCSTDGVRTSKSSTRSSAASRTAPVVADDPAGERRLVVRVRAPGCRRRRSRPPGRRAAGPRGRGRPRRRARASGVAPRRASRPRSRIDPGDRRAQAGHRLDQLGLAVALDAGDADDLARAHVERSRRRPPTWPRSSATCRSVGPRAPARRARPGSLSTVSCTARPTIIAASSRPRSSRPVSAARPRAPRRITVMRSAIARTSFSLWVMKMIDLPARSRATASTSNSSSVSCGVSTAVGSSRMRHLRLAVERLDDLDALLDADRRGPRPRRRRRRPARSARSISATRAGRRRRSSRPNRPADFVPSMTFSVTVNTGTSMKCWWTIPSPAAIASLGLIEMRLGSPSISDLALVGAVQPVEDVHERRLAGAVLAEEGVDLALLDGQVDVVVGDHAGEPLRDAAKLEPHARASSSGR